MFPKNIKSILIVTMSLVMVLSSVVLYADCDYMAMLSKNNFQISQFPTETDYFFQFQKDRSSATIQEDGYGIVYYKNGQYTIPYDHSDPLSETNQAYYLFGEWDHSWYQHHGPSGQTEFPQPEFPGYYWNDSNYQSEHPSKPDYDWIDISGIGTQVTFTHNDQASGPFNVGFDFEFYSEVEDQFIINPNGWIGFGEDNTSYNTEYGIPHPGAPNSAIFGFWDDLNPINNNPNGIPGGNVYYHSNTDRLVVWFDDVVEWSSSEPTEIYNFQIILYSNGNIKIQYQSVQGTTNSGTIGIQNNTGSDGLQVVDNANFTINDSYVENELAVLFSTEAYPEPLDIAEERIMNSANEAIIVLGHDRNRAFESRYAISQHPFRFSWNDKTYTFQHNGYHDYKEAMRYYCLQQDNNWFNIHPLNWEIYGSTIEDLSTVNDTEILFHYIMAHIIQYEGDVVGGIISALNEEAVYDDVNDIYLNFDELFQDDVTNKINITLSDGEALYVFRNTGINGNSYNLSYRDYANGFVGVKTQGTIPNGTQIQQFSLIEIPRSGEIVTYENIFDLDAKLFTSGVTWSSFPRLTEQGTSNDEIFEQAYYENGFNGLLQDPITGELSINGFNKILGYRDGDIKIEYDDGEFIDDDFDNMLFRHEGYKIEVEEGAEPTTLIVNGERLGSYTLDMLDLERYWLGYYIPYPQNIEDAFGDFWGDVNRVWAEDWYYDAHLIQRGGDPTQLSSNSTKGKTMEYGKMYIVDMYRDVEDFSWYGSTTVEEPIKKTAPENFSFTEKMDYEVIDVINIPSNVTEIGVFEDDVCVGAITVEDSCEQILVYSDNANRDPIPFSFEIVTGRGLSFPIKDYLVLNPMTGEFEPSVIISGRQSYSAIKFDEQEEPENIISRPVLNGNYPNPFNPTTTISFSLPAEQDIELTIFNIKGQKVKTLYSGSADVGDHSIIWEGKDNNDKQVSSGIYFYKLTTNNKELTRKMLMMK